MHGCDSQVFSYYWPSSVHHCEVTHFGMVFCYTKSNPCVFINGQLTGMMLVKILWILCFSSQWLAPFLALAERPCSVLLQNKVTTHLEVEIMTGIINWHYYAVSTMCGGEGLEVNIILVRKYFSTDLL